WPYMNSARSSKLNISFFKFYMPVHPFKYFCFFIWKYIKKDLVFQIGDNIPYLQASLRFEMLHQLFAVYIDIRNVLYWKRWFHFQRFIEYPAPLQFPGKPVDDHQFPDIFKCIIIIIVGDGFNLPVVFKIQENTDDFFYF